MADRVEESVEIIRRDRDREPRLPRRRLARAADAAGRPAHVQRAAQGARRRRPRGPRRVPRVQRPADRAPRLAGPEPARALEARFRPRPARPAAGRPARGGRVRRRSRRTAAARKRGVHLDADASPTRRSASATTRSGSARSSPTSSATRSSSRRAAGRSASTSARPPTGRGSIVTDTGVGIDPAELPHIFERFYRGSRANEARGSGSGLGLAIVRSIVDMHGGTVAVESRLGQGSPVHRGRCRATRGWSPGTPAAERAGASPSADAAGRTERRPQRDGNFTVRPPAGESGARTLGAPDLRGRSPVARLQQGPPTTMTDDRHRDPATRASRPSDTELHARDARRPRRPATPSPRAAVPARPGGRAATPRRPRHAPTGSRTYEARPPTSTPERWYEPAAEPAPARRRRADDARRRTGAARSSPRPSCPPSSPRAARSSP